MRGLQVLKGIVGIKAKPTPIERNITHSTGDLYAEAMTDDTATEQPKLQQFRKDVPTGGQGTEFGADCVARYLGRGGKGTASTKSDIKKAERFCGVK